MKEILKGIQLRIKRLKKSRRVYQSMWSDDHFLIIDAEARLDELESLHDWIKAKAKRDLVITSEGHFSIRKNK